MGFLDYFENRNKIEIVVTWGNHIQSLKRLFLGLSSIFNSLNYPNRIVTNVCIAKFNIKLATTWWELHV